MAIFYCISHAGYFNLFSQIYKSPQMLRGCSQFSRCESEEERGAGFSGSISRRDSMLLPDVDSLQDDCDKAKLLEQEVLSLTRDKKQLMTHLHWLSRQRGEQSQCDSLPSRFDDVAAKKLSLEEGNASSFDSHVAGLHLARGKRFEVISRNESVDDRYVGEGKYLEETPHLGEKKLLEESRYETYGNGRKEALVGLQGDGSSEEELIERLNRLKILMLQVKQVAAKNRDACDSIFQLSFQNFRHPNEPRSYSLWSSCEDEIIPPWSSPARSQECLNMQIGAATGYRSLETYPFPVGLNASGMCHCSLGKRNSSISSPELFLGKNCELRPVATQHSLNSTMKREVCGLSRSLSDQEAKSSRSAITLDPIVLAKKRGKPAFSTLTPADESEKAMEIRRHIIDEVARPTGYNSLDHVMRPPEINSSIEDSGHMTSTSNLRSSRRFYTENLIS